MREEGREGKRKGGKEGRREEDERRVKEGKGNTLMDEDHVS